MYNDRYTSEELLKYARTGFMEMLDEIDEMIKDKKKSKDDSERTLSAYTQKIMIRHMRNNLGIPIS